MNEATKPEPGVESTAAPAQSADVPAAAAQAPALPATETQPAEPGESTTDQAAPAPEAEASTEIRSLREQLLEARQALRRREAELETSQTLSRESLAKLKDQHERTLRAIADLDNYKKRATREREESAKFGQERLLKDLLPVLDNFDRALEHARPAVDLEAVKAGLAMVRKLFEDLLGRHGVKGFSALGQPFDPTRHEAIQVVESDAAASGTVVSEVVRGFFLHDRLLRPAMVAVAKARAEASPRQPDEAGQAATPPEQSKPAPEPPPTPSSAGPEEC